MSSDVGRNWFSVVGILFFGGGGGDFVKAEHTLGSSTQLFYLGNLTICMKCQFYLVYIFVNIFIHISIIQLRN